MFITHPIQYLMGIKLKIRVNKRVSSNRWNTNSNLLKAKNYVKEIELTVDKQIKWSWNKMLRDYYRDRVKLIEDKLQTLIYDDRSININ